MHPWRPPPPPPPPPPGMARAHGRPETTAMVHRPPVSPLPWPTTPTGLPRPFVAAGRPPHSSYRMPPPPPRLPPARFLPPRPALMPPMAPPLPPPRPPLAVPHQPNDTDSMWLDEFRSSHLGRDISHPVREPPLRRLRTMAALASPLIAELQAVAKEALSIEARMASAKETQSRAEMLTTTPSDELSRLQTQHKKLLAQCVRLKAELDAMQAPSLFVSPDDTPKLRAFVRRVQKKKEYRRRRAKQLRRRGSVVLTTGATKGSSGVLLSSGSSSATSASTPASTTQEDEHQVDGLPAHNQTKPHEDANFADRARRLQLLLDIKEARSAGGHDAEAANSIERDRKTLRDAIQSRRKRKRINRKADDVPSKEMTASPNKQPTKPPLPLAASVDPVVLMKLADTETLTFQELVVVRRAWDGFIVDPRTPGASSIPPHFVVPPPVPSAAWSPFVARDVPSS